MEPTEPIQIVNWKYKTLIEHTSSLGKIDAFMNHFPDCEVLQMCAMPGDRLAIVLKYDPLSHVELEGKEKK